MDTSSPGMMAVPILSKMELADMIHQRHNNVMARFQCCQTLSRLRMVLMMPFLHTGDVTVRRIVDVDGLVLGIL